MKWYVIYASNSFAVLTYQCKDRVMFAILVLMTNGMVFSGLVRNTYLKECYARNCTQAKYVSYRWILHRLW